MSDDFESHAMDESPAKPLPANPGQVVPPPQREEFREKLRKWIPWVREQIDNSGDIPTVIEIIGKAAGDSPGEHLLFDSALERVSTKDLESWFGDELAQDPTDVLVRAAVLSCVKAKMVVLESDLEEAYDDLEDRPLNRSEIEDGLSPLRESLRLLVGFLPVEECPATWRNFKWEIMNSYLARDWERAVRLYNRAADLNLMNPGEIAVLRGQFRFLAVFDRRIEEDLWNTLKEKKPRFTLDHLTWEPQIYGLTVDGEILGGVLGKLLLRNGMCDQDGELVLGDSERTLLFDAAQDLEKGFREVPDLPHFYHAVLAKCCYCVGRFHDAAENYRALLRTNEGQPTQTEGTRRRLFASLSLSYRKANESAHAKEILERWAQDFPDEKGVYMQLAEIEAQDANYPGAIENLRKEIDRNPTADTDWKLTTLLAIGATQDTTEAIRNELMAHSDLWHPVSSILQLYWSPFAKLGESARSEWVCGVVLSQLPQIPEKKRLQKAATACATALEIELRERVFRRYRTYIHERPSLRQHAEDGRLDRRTDKFCQFLVGDAYLSLGEMQTILKISRNAPEVILRDFKAWLNRFQSQLTLRLDKLETVRKFRNPAVHEGQTEVDPNQAIECCREILAALN